jgi:phytoene dehydrogenase-like protein
MDIMVDKYDAIIIGTGIGGSVVGALLAHAGWKILILEKNKIIGGRCTSYDRDGFTIDLGMHNYTAPDIGVTTEVLRQVEMPNAIEWISLRDLGRAILQFGDKRVDYSRKTMEELAPEAERNNLRTFFAQGFMLSDQEVDELWDVPVAEWVNNITKDPMIHLVVDNLVSQVFCVPSSVASTAEWIKITRGMSKSKSRGLYYPKGGNISIPKAFISAIEKYGGKVKLNAPVKRVMIEDGAAVGVRLKDGSEFRAPVIISNADIKSTVKDLVGEEHFPKDYAKTIRNLTYSAAAVTLKVCLEEKVIDEWMVIYIPDVHHPTYRVAEDMEKGKIPEWVGAVSFITSNVDPSLAPPGKQCVSFVVACPAGQDWKEWKKVLLNNFYRVHPQAKNKVMSYWFETSDWLDAWAGKGGSIIGVGQKVGQVHEHRPSVTTPVKGLYFSSADVGKYHIGVELAADAGRELFEVLTR